MFCPITACSVIARGKSAGYTLNRDVLLTMWETDGVNRKEETR